MRLRPPFGDGPPGPNARPVGHARGAALAPSSRRPAPVAAGREAAQPGGALSRRRLLALSASAAAAPFLPLPARGQGYAGLGAAPDGFLLPDRAPLVFPADHGPHPGFRIEWWYITANLRGADGTPFGIQWTLFRQGIAPPDPATGAALATATAPAVSPDPDWAAPVLWLAHAAATGADAHRFAEKQARGGVGQAAVLGGPPFDAWIDDWALEGGPLEGDGPPLTLSARGPGFSYRLNLAADGPLALHGGDGFSVKSERGHASRYYSQPWYRAEGALALDGAEQAVSGHAWLDREWSSQPLDADQEGWDWFSLRLSPEACLMLYRLRHGDGRDHLSGSWITRAGAEDLSADRIGMEVLERVAVAGRPHPLRWRLKVGGLWEGEVAPLNPNALMDTRFRYWEGPVLGAGAEGYMELVGY